MKRFGILLVFGLFVVSLMACQTITTSFSQTTDTSSVVSSYPTTLIPTTLPSSSATSTQSSTQGSTTIPTTSSPTTIPPTSNLTTSLNYENIVVSGFSTNNSLRFSNISHMIAGWTTEHNDIAQITVDDFFEYQPFMGAGAALTLSAAYVIDQSPDRDAIIQYLFSKEGLGINVVRLTVGASDFVPAHIGHYTYNDRPNNVADMNLEHFSIEQDRLIIDILKEALLINPDITFIAAPWSAPAWMKTNKNLYMGSLMTDKQNVYANYLIKYLQAMENEGIVIDYLSIQNEPFHAAYNYPSMLWDRYLSTTFIADFLGPKLLDLEMNTKIMIWDHNPVDNSGQFEQYPLQVLRSAGAKFYVDSVGVHCYTGTHAQMKAYLQLLYEANPDIEIWMTECTATTQYKNIESNIAWSVKRMYLEAYNQFAMGTTYWNMVLDPAGSVHLGGCTNCTGLLSVPINGSSGFTVEADGYLTGHLTKTIPAGSRRIKTSSTITTYTVTAFKSMDGVINLVVHNDGSARATTILWRDSRFRVTLPANSITTLTWNLPN
ncbi:MAG: glycoside hydrolase family 30 beta sandwich domain-containing protein [Candidatus Izemoplasmatales bacterium]|nr:glycoside hydrolase family 30 beta sandwich domain-containing protein [bacterium]MDZ4195992.1 glycoside hydrolase family 30 beta sandwich domain-containing protein [Candidatus Izemoplasmatales bacterium]